ncbi:DUF1345 domain-containing protein [Nonomuraea roseola]|uniref:DUF1345 domain-containing protein n=1 Tax=Nonomuraea roseola TaxID=46179 RepID=A0ABV5QH23_9ACTN
MPRSVDQPREPRARRGVSAQVEVLVSALCGVAVAVPLVWVSSPALGVLVGWDTACVVYMTWIWTGILRRDAAETARRATTTDPDRAVTDIVLLTAAVASLVAVGIVIVRATHSQGAAELVGIALGLASVVLSWAVVHTVFTLRYAHLYYAGPDGGIDFNGSGPPSYSDFAYLAFTIGMTFQVSDTALRSTLIRRAALRHALLSYLFGTGILATTINLVASLSSR